METKTKALVDCFMYKDAENFHDAAMMLKKSPPYYDKKPFDVLMAFSTEVFLKSINVTTIRHHNEENPCEIDSIEIDHQYGHNLDSLFKSHSDEIKGYLSTRYKKEYNQDLLEDLEANAGVFEQRRYRLAL